jgi:hypothetical protein
MQPIATIQFPDAISSEESPAIVRADSGVVGLALSQRSNGDLEVMLPLDAARDVVKALQRALALTTGST